MEKRIWEKDWEQHGDTYVLDTGKDYVLISQAGELYGLSVYRDGNLRCEKLGKEKSKIATLYDKIAKNYNKAA